MPLFICEKCGAIENTALGSYWMSIIDDKPALCSECLKGKWHGKFEKEYYQDLSDEKKESYRLLNEKKYLQTNGKEENK